MPEKNYNRAFYIVKSLTNAGFSAYFAGGWVRDRLLGKESADIDIATNATPKEIKKIFDRVIGVGEHFGVMLVIIDGNPFEVATFRSDIGYSDGRHPDSIRFSSPKEDAQRRDFTINGLFFDPIEDRILDFVDGQKDLTAGLIKTIGLPDVRFSEDYLRLLRAIRFAARFSFTIDAKTALSIKNQATNIGKISQERIFSEITKMIVAPNAKDAIELLHNMCLLKQVLPEIENLIGVKQPPEFHPEGDVFTHTTLLFTHLEAPSPTLAWSALLHDIGKPKTMTITDRIRFNNHQRVSSIMSKRVLSRMKSPNVLICDVAECVDNHMNFMNIPKMRISTLKKFLSRPTIEDELELHRADCLASHGDINNYTICKEHLATLQKEELKPIPFIKGRDLIELKQKPSPLFKVILNHLYDLQLENNFTTRSEAISFLKKNLNSIIQTVVPQLKP